MKGEGIMASYIIASSEYDYQVVLAEAVIDSASNDRDVFEETIVNVAERLEQYGEAEEPEYDKVAARVVRDTVVAAFQRRGIDPTEERDFAETLLVKLLHLNDDDVWKTVGEHFKTQAREEKRS